MFILVKIWLLMLLLAYGQGFAQVVIEGKIKNYDGKTRVYYAPTIEGVNPSTGSSRDIAPNANGSFSIKFENRGIGTTRINFARLSYYFLHDEKSKINLVIDQEKIVFPKLTMQERLDYDFTYHDQMVDSIKQVATDFIGGDFAEINRFYNRNVRSLVAFFSVQGRGFSIFIADANTPTKAVNAIDSLVQIELIQIDNLESQVNIENTSSNVMTPEIKRFLKNEVHAFYGSVFLNAMFLKKSKQVLALLKNPEVPRTIYNPEWEKLIEDWFKRASKDILPTANSSYYNQYVINAKYTLDITHNMNTILTWITTR